jgi:hypothetical protein
MNIFVVDRNPKKAAQMLCDKHVVKMPLECAQMLSTIAGGPYKPSHVNHPCTKWAREKQGNFNWLLKHGFALCKEYTHRYGKVHSCEAVLEQIAKMKISLPKGRTEFYPCVPDECLTNDVVTSYHQYYFTKARFATWKKRNPPDWWLGEFTTPVFGKFSLDHPCRLCGKPKGEHLAQVAECPKGKKSRIGCHQFGPETFRPVSGWKAKRTFSI